MGFYLSRPKTEKVSTDASNAWLTIGTSSMQGWRFIQEDAHNSILNFDTESSFFAVYDGHGGAEVASFCADNFPTFLQEQSAYKNGDLEMALIEAFLGFDKTLLEPHVIEVLKIIAHEKNLANSVEDFDAAVDASNAAPESNISPSTSSAAAATAAAAGGSVQNSPTTAEGSDEPVEVSTVSSAGEAPTNIEPGNGSGCTAIVALLRGRDLYVANVGDSRCVVSRKGRPIEMSLDHKPENEEESARISRAGGHVTAMGRINGGLNLSRAIGDHAYKMNAELPPEGQMISALPDIKKLIITPDDEFMILACDGIWNSMSNEEVVQFVRLRLRRSRKLSRICEELFDKILAPNTDGDGTGCDNMTAIIVRFEPKLLEKPTSINPNEVVTAKRMGKKQQKVTTVKRKNKKA